MSSSVNRNSTAHDLETRGRLADAVELYEANVAEGFEKPRPYDRLAAIYRRHQDYDNEIRVLEKAVGVFRRQAGPGGDADVSQQLEGYEKRLEHAKTLRRDHADVAPQPITNDEDDQTGGWRTGLVLIMVVLGLLAIVALLALMT